MVLASYQWKVFSIDLRLPIGFLLVMMKPESNWCQLPLKAPEEEKQETTASTAAAKNISVDAAVEAVISKMDSMFKNNLHHSANAWLMSSLTPG